LSGAALPDVQVRTMRADAESAARRMEPTRRPRRTRLGSSETSLVTSFPSLDVLVGHMSWWDHGPRPVFVKQFAPRSRATCCATT